VLFDAFGDNALALELRVYLPSMENWLNTRTALHDAIYHKFQQSGIEISFPQRDVHLDTTAPLDIRLHRAAPRAPAPSPDGARASPDPQAPQGG
jgi:potassium efflux system protein